MTCRRTCSDPLFNENGELNGRWHLIIACRLDPDGRKDIRTRCQHLARLIDVDDMVVWAMAMWNAAPSLDIAGKLRKWVQAGVPLPDGECRRAS